MAHVEEQPTIAPAFERARSRSLPLTPLLRWLVSVALNSACVTAWQSQFASTRKLCPTTRHLQKKYLELTCQQFIVDSRLVRFGLLVRKGMTERNLSSRLPWGLAKRKGTIDEEASSAYGRRAGTDVRHYS